jgi:hypothetical protein
LNLISYLMFQCLEILNLLLDLDVIFLLRFIQIRCLLILRIFKILLDLQIFALEILVNFDIPLFDVLSHLRNLCILVFRYLLELNSS